MLAPGGRAPSFVAPGTEGIVDFDALVKQRPAVLYFFPRAMTPGWTAEAVEFNRLLPEFESLGVAVIGISVDSLERLRRFRDKYDLRFPLVSDENRSIGSAFGTLKGDLSSTHERDTVLIDRAGTVLLAYQRVGAVGHAATVLTDTRRLREEGRI